MDTTISRLRGFCYVDHAGAALHCDAQSEAMARLLNTSLLANPHSAPHSEEESARALVLKLVNADARDYAVIWTSGATAALKLVGENFVWSPNTSFAYHGNVHNSALGIREYAKRGGATFRQLLLDENVHECGDGNGGLFAVSAQCNFSGVKPDFVRMTREMQAKRWYVCLDAAALCATSPLDLHACPADFVCLSFYKIFGLPSGLGALIARRDAVAKAFVPQRPYFGGGTVEACAASEDYVAYRRDVSARYEDGTPAFLSIATLRVSFDLLSSLGGMDSILQRSFRVAEFFARRLAQFQHHNGRPSFVVYGKWSEQDVNSKVQGPTVTFNGMRSDGSWIGYSEIGKIAALNKVILRTGCFCNAGACQQWLGLSAAQVRQNLQRGHVCWDEKDVIDGNPTGAVRVSFGWSSREEDAEAVLNLLKCAFVEDSAPSAQVEHPIRDPEGCDTLLRAIWVYPVKSFGGMQVQSWEIGPRGLLYDREWAVVDRDGTYLSQKSLPVMCRVYATVDLGRKKLVLTCDGYDPLDLPLDPRDEASDWTAEQRVTVCGDACPGLPYGASCSAWLERVLQRPCTLVRMAGSGRNNIAPRGTPEIGDPSAKLAPKISFANEAQFLVISAESLDDLCSRLGENERGAADATRFRANFVVGGLQMRAYTEDECLLMVIDTQQIFRIVGPCARCEMICVDSATLTRSREPLRTLATYRRTQGRIFFGSLFTHDVQASSRPHMITVGSNVHFTFAPK